MISIKKVWQFDSREEVTRRRKIVAKMGGQETNKKFPRECFVTFFSIDRVAFKRGNSPPCSNGEIERKERVGRVEVLSRRASDTHARARQSGETLTRWPSHPRTRHIRLIFHTRFCTRGNYNNNRPLVMRASNRCPAWPPFVL